MIQEFSSCDGHGKKWPDVSFLGTEDDARRALAVARDALLPVCGLERIWHVENGERGDEYWTLYFNQPFMAPADWKAAPPVDWEAVHADWDRRFITPPLGTRRAPLPLMTMMICRSKGHAMSARAGALQTVLRHGQRTAAIAHIQRPGSRDLLEVCPDCQGAGTIKEDDHVQEARSDKQADPRTRS